MGLNSECWGYGKETIMNCFKVLSQRFPGVASCAIKIWARTLWIHVQSIIITSHCSKAKSLQDEAAEVRFLLAVAVSVRADHIRNQTIRREVNIINILDRDNWTSDELVPHFEKSDESRSDERFYQYKPKGGRRKLEHTEDRKTNSDLKLGVGTV